jgi:flagellar basal body-associated protein FliL
LLCLEMGMDTVTAVIMPGTVVLMTEIVGTTTAEMPAREEIVPGPMDLVIILVMLVLLILAVLVMGMVMMAIQGILAGTTTTMTAEQMVRPIMVMVRVE